MRRAKEHYVNNKDFLHAIIQYKDKVAAAKEKGEKKPPVGEYIGDAFLKLHSIYHTNLTLSTICLKMI